MPCTVLSCLAGSQRSANFRTMLPHPFSHPFSHHYYVARCLLASSHVLAGLLSKPVRNEPHPQKSPLLLLSRTILTIQYHPHSHHDPVRTDLDRPASLPCVASTGKNCTRRQSCAGQFPKEPHDLAHVRLGTLPTFQPSNLLKKSSALNRSCSCGWQMPLDDPPVPP